MKELNTGNVKQIYLCGFISSGTYELEQQLHKKFEYARKKGEWYNSTLLIDYINANSDMMAEIENIDGKLYIYKKMNYITRH